MPAVYDCVTSDIPSQVGFQSRFDGFDLSPSGPAIGPRDTPSHVVQPYRYLGRHLLKAAAAKECENKSGDMRRWRKGKGRA